MATKEHYLTKFEAGKFYHVYNRTVDKKPLFKNDENYIYFLNKYNEYISPVADTYAYCLLGNHFHILLRIKELPTLESKTTHEIVSHQFRKFFQSYAMAFNKQQNRIGTLFQTPFKRVLIDKESYFSQLVFYIHANPQTHGLVKDFRDWNWSSYHRIIASRKSGLRKEEVIEWFGNVDEYIAFHQHEHQIERNIIIEENM